MKLTPTDEQIAIIDHHRTESGSAVVAAYAGTAKTSTMVMLAGVKPKVPSLALAFNKKIQLELEKRLPEYFTTKTLNGLGHSAFGQAVGKRLTIDTKKTGKLITQVSRDAGYEVSEEDWDILRKLVTSAKMRGLVPESFPQSGKIPDDEESWTNIAADNWVDATENHIRLARLILSASIRQGFEGTIDFDDQTYLSVLFGGIFPKFPFVSVDEAQDLSPLNHAMLRKMGRGQLTVIGDPKQAIYAFRGADSDSMNSLRALRTDWHEFKLSTTFRCPKVVVERQQHHAPGFTAYHTNPQGLFSRIRALIEGEGWQWKQVTEHLAEGQSVAVICRNNAPLLSLAFKLLRKGIGCHMLRRDIGKGLITLSSKIEPEDSAPIDTVMRKIDEWMVQQKALARANGKDEKLDSIEDRGEGLLAVIEGSGVTTAGALREALRVFFARETGLVTLSTAHASKGLEFDVVVHLDPWRIPSQQSKRAAEAGDTRALLQEANLRYVLETRAKLVLLEADAETFG